MKKLLACLSMLGLLFLVGCGSVEPEEESEQATTTTQVTTEPETTELLEEQLPFTVEFDLPEGYAFASYYAKTSEYFYAVVWGTEWPRTYYIYRALLSDIGAHELIFRSEGYRETTIYGLSAQGLYIESWHHATPTDREIFFLPHGNNQVELVFAGQVELQLSESDWPGRLDTLIISDTTYVLTRYSHVDGTGMPWEDVKFQRLGNNGEVLETILEHTESDNNAVTMSRLGDMILLTEFLAGGGEWITFFALYDPATGALFSVN